MEDKAKTKRGRPELQVKRNPSFQPSFNFDANTSLLYKPLPQTDTFNHKDTNGAAPISHNDL